MKILIFVLQNLLSLMRCMTVKYNLFVYLYCNNIKQMLLSQNCFKGVI
jgi:hypothetical protein